MIKLFFVFLFPTIVLASEPVGSYDRGTLVDGECLEEDGEGYMQLFRDVGHIYGTSSMISMLKKTASELAGKYPGRDRLQIEDISAKNGGDIDPHGSHENGLDVDLQYFKADFKEHDPRTAADVYADPMVIQGRTSENFDVERNWELMKSLHRNGSVARIFVDQTLKKSLCSYAKSKGEQTSHMSVLRSLRHVENHQDHMHVRLRCPATARRCVNQPELTGGSGCP